MQVLTHWGKILVSGSLHRAPFMSMESPKRKKGAHVAASSMLLTFQETFHRWGRSSEGKTSNPVANSHSIPLHASTGTIGSLEGKPLLITNKDIWPYPKEGRSEPRGPHSWESNGPWKQWEQKILCRYHTQFLGIPAHEGEASLGPNFDTKYANLKIKAQSERQQAFFEI